MRKLIIGLMLIGLLVSGYYVFKPMACQAGFCMNTQCTNSSVCSQGCFCAKENLALWGKCMSN
jgi:hypothetical protein